MTEIALTVHQSPHLMPAMSMGDAVERFNSLTHFAREIMHEGTDYGTVPGTDKPTLLKPGAEKLTTFFGLSVQFEIIEKMEDWMGIDHNGEPFFYYWFRCQMRRGDLLIAEADGSCNSWESKYRYRWAERTCPNCKKTAIIKGKQEYGGGWLCWAKRGGCGAKFKDADPAIVGQELGRILNPDPANITNTIVKMAQKRALVAATLLAVNASEYFTQDMEDLPIIDVTPTPISDKGPDWEAVPQEAKPAVDKPVEKPADNADGFDSPRELLLAVQEKTDHYKGLPHMLNALKKIEGDEYRWPQAGDVGGYEVALARLIDHAEASKAAI